MASSQLRLDIFSQPGLMSPRVAAAVEALAAAGGNTEFAEEVPKDIPSW